MSGAVDGRCRWVGWEEGEAEDVSGGLGVGFGSGGGGWGALEGRHVCGSGGARLKRVGWVRGWVGGWVDLPCTHCHIMIDDS